MSRLPSLLLTSVALLISGCGSPKVPEPTRDGNYVVFSGENNVRLVVIQNSTKLSAEGTYENMTGLPPTVGQLAPSSVSGIFKVSTSTCGKYEFVLSKGDFMLCTDCDRGYPLSGYKDCSFEGRRMPMDWQAVGL
ncbi:hypothetical protein [Stenotrophomonas sp. TWI602]|uniref:hypothetical protein n=1 Tax=Stenotrophomonas sp. TWI602 TaxID=3136786 RepID=UPI00320B8382